MLKSRCLHFTNQGKTKHLVQSRNQVMVSIEEFLDLKSTLRELLGICQVTTVPRDLNNVHELYLKSNQKGIVLVNQSNQQATTPQKYLEYLNTLKPELSILCDPQLELYTQKPLSKNQEYKAHLRWMSWLEVVLKNSNVNSIACCVGTTHEYVRKSMLDIAVNLDKHCHGYGIVLPMIDSSVFDSCIQGCLEGLLLHLQGTQDPSNLPSDSLTRQHLIKYGFDKSLICLGAQGFSSYLNCFKRGFVIDDSWVDRLVDASIVVSVDFTEKLDKSDPSAVSKLADGKLCRTKFAEDCEYNDMFMDLKSKHHETDLTPLLEGCECFACRNHTRAYIHHLILVNDMLSFALIKEHNLHQLQKFFADVGSSIENDTFETNYNKFNSIS